MRILNETILLNGDMSQSQLTSLPIQLSLMVVYAVQAIITGSPTGTLKLQASNDGVNWTDISGSSASITGASTIMFNLYWAGYVYAQAVYTKTSGSGALTIIANAKG